MAEKRKSISKKIRFEVYKRDAFTCQYCGSKAPDVILEIDHIDPISKGGSNDMLNLITSCFDCNRGKSDRKIDDNSVITKQRDSLEELNEKKIQMKMMMDWKKSLLSLSDDQVDEVDLYFNEMTGFTIKEEYKKTKIRALIRKYGLSEVIDSLTISFDSYYKEGLKEEVEKMLDKLGGILYNRSLKERDPESYSKNMTKAYIRRSFDYVNEADLRKYIDLLFEADYSNKAIIEVVRTCRSWSNFKNEANEILYGEE